MAKKKFDTNLGVVTSDEFKKEQEVFCSNTKTLFDGALKNCAVDAFSNGSLVIHATLDFDIDQLEKLVKRGGSVPTEATINKIIAGVLTVDDDVTVQFVHKEPKSQAYCKAIVEIYGDSIVDQCTVTGRGDDYVDCTIRLDTKSMKILARQKKHTSDIDGVRIEVRSKLVDNTIDFFKSQHFLKNRTDVTSGDGDSIKSTTTVTTTLATDNTASTESTTTVTTTPATDNTASTESTTTVTTTPATDNTASTESTTTVTTTLATDNTASTESTTTVTTTPATDNTASTESTSTVTTTPATDNTASTESTTTVTTTPATDSTASTESTTTVTTTPATDNTASTESTTTVTTTPATDNTASTESTTTVTTTPATDNTASTESTTTVTTTLATDNTASTESTTTQVTPTTTT
ncbi:hypothetical protein NP493_137g04050 [Ridgeia piscesae]|uniref:Uncharacterized protein n=1 Tax=Ridgeia piscesae TaxID=27915 RepID=A0AAD9UG80_RIDPI|nr:hypothetical protein NP493_137g04050 [Ridgeia piscesae]